MDANKILRAIEDLAVEVAVWLILLPKTFVAVLMRPEKVVAHFELSQQSAEPRSDEYLEPVRFWFLLGPTYLLVEQWLQGHTKGLVYQFGDSFEKMAAVATLTLFIAPVGFAWQICLERGQTLTKTNLELAFRSQCYPFGVVTFIFNISLTVFGRLGQIGAAVFWVAILWHFFAQLRIARADSRIVYPLGYVFLGGFKVLILFAIWLAISLALYISGKLH